jgi:Flp pilus assembly protein TadD
MLATKFPTRKFTFAMAVTTLVVLVGCVPPGPRALLEGDELLREGETKKAISELKRATELLPAEPRAWNLLGLAYHRAGDSELAAQAYRQALMRDRSNVVAVAHYNLGCLLLEKNLPAGAVDALRSYTLLTNSPSGFARLGSAQLRLRQFSEAEKSFANALRFDSNSVEAINGLGVIRAQRGQREAPQYFAAALQADSKYFPALLNSAVLAQQNPATKAVALQRYRDYLAARGNGPHAAAVKSLVRQLESELAPTIPPARTANPLSTKTNVATNALVSVITNRNPPSIPAKSNTVATIVKTNPPAVFTNKPAPPVSVPVTVPVTVVAVTTQSPPRFAATEPLMTKPLPPTEPTRAIAVTESSPDVSPAVPQSSPAPEPKRGFFSRLNPFGGKPQPATNGASRVVVVNPEAALPSAPAEPLNGRPVFPRYKYISPAPPAAGNRAISDRSLQQALAAQRAGRTVEANAAYVAALAADPSYFEAQYNAALLSFQNGDMARALAGWETALALQPDSLAARYSFALALKQAGHAQDAALELEKVLEAKPDDARTHLALGNLYAQQLLEPEKARLHYKRLLELDPRNSQGAAIRFWLAANP